MAVEKLGFFLSMIVVSALVTSLIVNIHMFRVIDQLNIVNNQLDYELQKQNIERLSAWVNETVGFGGRLFGPLDYSGFPYNYLLLEPINVTLVSFDPSKTIRTMVRPETSIIGVSWKGNEHYAFDHSVIVGVVKEQNITISSEKHIVFYYIEAHYIHRSPNDS